MRVRWEMKRYDEHLPHFDKRILTGRTADGLVASKGLWLGFGDRRAEMRYGFAAVRKMLQREAERRAA